MPGSVGSHGDKRWLLSETGVPAEVGHDEGLFPPQSDVLQMNVSEYGRSPVSLSRHVSSLRRISDILNLPKYVCCLFDPRITTPSDDTASSIVSNDQGTVCANMV